MTKGRHVDGKSDSHGDGPFRSRVAGDWYAWAAFEPAGGRTAFPGFDAPRFKPPFTLPIRSTVLLEGFASLAHHADAGVAGKPPPLNPAYRLPAFKAWLHAHDLAHARTFYDRMVKGSTGTLHINAPKAISATGDTATERWLMQRAMADVLLVIG
jgi:hypothetical protein